MKHFYKKISVVVVVLVSGLCADAIPLATLAQKAPETPANSYLTLDGKTVIRNDLKPRPAVKSPASRASEDDDIEPKIYHPDGEYILLGKGTYCEGLFSFYGAPEQLRWEVDVEESAVVPGWYRIQPYKNSNPITDIIGATDDTYVYINATNPERVWFEDMILYDNRFIFSQLVVELDWTGYYEYGIMKDGIIDMSDAWFCAWNHELERWEHCEDGFLQIGLPGVKIPDYSMKASAEFHDADNMPSVIFEKGADISKVYVLSARGDVRMDYETAQIVVAEGDVVPNDINYLVLSDLSKNGRGVYSVCFAGVNSDGEIVAAASALTFIELDNDDEWEPYSRGYWQEGILSPHISGAGLQQLNVDIERHKTIPDYYRLVNPLAEHPLLKDYLVENGKHNHYIYVNATDHDFVYLDASEVGLQTPNGQSAVWSYVGMRLSEGYSAEQLKGYGYGGTMTDDGVITFPDNTLLYAETNYFGGHFVSSGDRVKIDLHKTINAAEIIVADDATAPVEYFNLQGLRIENPSHGLFIRKQGKTVTKVIIK